MNENELLNFLIPKMTQSSDVIVPPGDDCAMVKVGNKNVLMAVDQVIAGVHYTSDTDVNLIAEKLLKRNLSDIAAMGGIPTHAVMTLASNRSDQRWYQNFYQAMAKITQVYKVSMVGGDLAKSTAFIDEEQSIIEVCTLTIFGKINSNNKVLLRQNAEANDIVLVTGELGNSFKSEHHLNFGPRLSEGKFLAENDFSKCAIDISDGLILDATRVAIMSNCIIKIDDNSLPLRHGADKNMALSDGEDYELLFTVSPKKIIQLQKLWQQKFPNTKLTVIGEVMNNKENIPNGVVINQNGVILSDGKNIGYVHRG